MSALSDLRSSEAAGVLAEAWRWWTTELTALVPDRLRPDSGNAAHADIRLGPGTVDVELIADGTGRRFTDARSIEDLDAEAWEQLGNLIATSRTRIILSPPDCFVTTLRLPKAARKRLRSAVALQLLQIAPIEPAMLRWTLETIDIGEADMKVRVAMARTTRVEALREMFDARGMSVPPIHAATSEGTLQLAPGQDSGRRDVKSPDRRAWVVALILLATIPLTTIMGANLFASSAERRIASLQAEIGPRLEIERKARQAEDMRRALRPVLAHPTVSETVEDLAARIPVSDHVKRVERTADRHVRFTLETANSEGVSQALADSNVLEAVELAELDPAEGGGFLASYVGRQQ